MKIYLGADHAGFEMKEYVKDYLLSRDELDEVIDHGAFEFDEGDDYPDFVKLVADDVSIDWSAGKKESFGIIFGGSGQGEAIVANRTHGVRAAVYYGAPVATQTDADGADLDIISSSRLHNDANVLSLGARFLIREEVIRVIDLWLSTAFSGDERHFRRIAKIDE